MRNSKVVHLLRWVATAAVLIQWATSAQPEVDVRSTDHEEVQPKLGSATECLCSHRHSCEDGNTCGGVTYGPSRGAFPQGCRWRDVSPTNGIDQYEYWDELEQIWIDKRPVACTINVCILLASTNSRPLHAYLVRLAPNQPQPHCGQKKRSGVQI